MGFLTPALLGGVALIAIPIALHLIMRRQSQQFLFPALQFVRQRRQANRRKLQLRHWLLLALRCFLIAAIAFALARPTLKANGRGDQGGPPAVALVVDNSLRMTYVRNGKTRMDEATELAGELVSKLPDDATVAVSDLSRASAGFAPDLTSAATRLHNLHTSADARPLADAVKEAIHLVDGQEDRRPEVFVFTDLSAAAWNAEATKQIATALAEAPDVRLYVVDVGVADPQNASLSPLEIRRSVLRPGVPLHIETTVAANLKGEPPLVELSLENEEGQLEKRSQQIAPLGADGTARVALEIADLSAGVRQGAVELAGSDPLPIDNRRYFTVEVRDPAKVLLVAQRPDDALFVREAIAPSLLKNAGRFATTVTTFDKLGELALEDYQAVVLLDPPALGDEVWSRLDEYAAAGGGVGVALGHNADFKKLNEEASQKLLPAKLLRISRDETYLRPNRLDHPLLLSLRQYAESIPWPALRVFSYWQLGDLASDAYIVATYANDDPAIIERAAGRGRVVVLTTPLSDPLEPEGRDTWNVLPSPEAAPWVFLALAEELVGYLAQDADQPLDFVAGETARIRLDPREQVANYVLRLPDGQAETRVAPAGEAELSVGVTDQLGNYRVTAGGQSRTLDHGFSVNAPAELSDLTRVKPDELLAALPPDRATLTNNLDSLLQYVDVGRSGRELYPYLLGLVVLIWSAEHLLSNRFYRQSYGPAAVGNLATAQPAP